MGDRFLMSSNLGDRAVCWSCIDLTSC